MHDRSKGACVATCIATSNLLIVAAVQVSHLAHELWVDEAVRGDQVVRQRCLAVVHVRQDAYVADARLHAGP